MSPPTASPTLRLTLLLATFQQLLAFGGMRGGTRFFLDTADTAEYKALLPLGLFHGVTTNPTILQRSGVPCTVPAIAELKETAFEYGVDEFMAQAWGGTAEKLFDTGLQLRALDPERLVVKLPTTMAGLEAAGRLARVEGGTRVCLTACYNSQQALIAGAAGVEYLAPYLGRMSDAGKQGLEECITMQEVVEGMDAETRILVASIRDVKSMVTLATSGLDTFTFSPEVARALFDEPLTDAAAAAFEEAAVASG